MMRVLPARIWFAAILSLAGTSVFAQDASAPSASSSSSSPYKGLTSSSVYESKSGELPRFWGALTGSYVPFQLVTAKSETNSTTLEQITSKAQNGQAGGGVTLNYRLFGSYWLSVGGIYRFGGYDTT